MAKLFVGNLNPDTTSEDIRKRFGEFGEHMANDDDAAAAISALKGSVLDGSTINVEYSHGGRSRFKSSRRFERSDNPYRRPSGRFGPGWGDDRYPGPYGPPRRFDYPPRPSNGRYMPDRDFGRPMSSPMPRGPFPPPSRPPYRGPHASDRMPSPVKDYSKPPRSSGRSGFDGFNDYDRYREPVPSTAPPSRPNDYYDNYGSYSSGPGFDDYGDNERAPPYDNGFDYGYYDNGVDNRASAAPPRSAYAHGRP